MEKYYILKPTEQEFGLTTGEQFRHGEKYKTVPKWLRYRFQVMPYTKPQQKRRGGAK